MHLDHRGYALLVSSILTVVLVALVSMVPVPYALMRPGPAKDVLSGTGKGQLIVIRGHDTYPTSGSLDLVTVRVSGGPGSGATVWDVLAAWVDPAVDARPVAEVFAPDQTQQQIDDENAAEMVTSQEAATAAALTELDIAYTTHVTVAAVSKDSGARDHLEVGDVVSSIDGKPVSSLAEIRAVLAEVAAGTEVTVGVVRADKPLQVRFATSSTTDPDGTKRTILGVQPGATYDFPFSVTISIDDIGGPSAGMMFALGIIDKLTPGELTGGQRIAGTGTMDPDGTVGEIGGIRQKIVAARDAGATWFFVPEGNCPEIHQVPDGLRLVKVHTLDEAYHAAEVIGAGDQQAQRALPGCTQ